MPMVTLAKWMRTNAPFDSIESPDAYLFLVAATSAPGEIRAEVRWEDSDVRKKLDEATLNRWCDLASIVDPQRRKKFKQEMMEAAMFAWLLNRYDPRHRGVRARTIHALQGLASALEAAAKRLDDRDKVTTYLLLMGAAVRPMKGAAKFDDKPTLAKMAAHKKRASRFKHRLTDLVSEMREISSVAKRVADAMHDRRGAPTKNTTHLPLMKAALAWTSAVGAAPIYNRNPEKPGPFATIARELIQIVNPRHEFLNTFDSRLRKVVGFARRIKKP